jgi:hypothetical protein
VVRDRENDTTIRPADANRIYNFALLYTHGWRRCLT